MKFSFMTFSTPELTLDEVLAAARRYGYDGVEPRMDAGHAHGVELAATADQRKAIAEKAAAAGVELACLATSIRYADPAGRDEAVAQTHERIDLAGDIGATRMRVFGGGFPEDMSRDDAVAGVADALAACADHAAERGVTLCLETHDSWCDPAHVAAVIRRVDHAAVRVNWDVMHPVRTGLATMQGAFETLGPWIAHLHVHDGREGTGEFVPTGEGGYDHRLVISLLKQADFHGFCSGEWINWQPWAEHLPREIETLRRYDAGV